jgi:hypothetical protein
METGYNLHDRDVVDEHADAIITIVNNARGK